METGFTTMIRTQAKMLLGLERREETGRFRPLRLASVLMGFANLLACAYAGGALAADPTGTPLVLLLFLQLALLVLLHLFYHLGITARILQGTALLPLEPRARFLFKVAGPVMRPFTPALSLPPALLLAVTFRNLPEAAAAACCAMLLAATAVSVWMGAALGARGRGDSSLLSAGVLLALPTWIFLALLLDLESVLTALPPVGLAASAVRAGVSGDAGTAALHLSALCALALIPLVGLRPR